MGNAYRRKQKCVVALVLSQVNKLLDGDAGTSGSCNPLAGQPSAEVSRLENALSDFSRRVVARGLTDRQSLNLSRCQKEDAAISYAPRVLS